MLKLVSDRLFALLTFTCLMACNTYKDSLLTAIPSEGEAGKSGGGMSGVAGSGDHGGYTAAGGDYTGGDAGESAAQAGESGTSSSGSSGSSSSSGSVGDGGGGDGGGGTFGVAGSSSGAGGAGSAGTSAAGADNGPVGPQIDDFEDQDGFILRLSMRNGPWYVVHDATATGIGPTMTIGALAAADLRPSSTSTSALHLTASGFADWGVGVGADMVNQMAKKVPYDVTAYSAIRFYAKIATGTTATVKVLLPNTYSDADGAKCSAATCGDHLSKSLSGLKTTWDLYEVKFSDLTQQGFGLKQTLPFDLTSVYSVQFTQPNKLKVDLWIDDVTFVPK